MYVCRYVPRYKVDRYRSYIPHKNTRENNQVVLLCVIQTEAILIFMTEHCTLHRVTKMSEPAHFQGPAQNYSLKKLMS